MRSRKTKHTAMAPLLRSDSPDKRSIRTRRDGFFLLAMPFLMILVWSVIAMLVRERLPTLESAAGSPIDYQRAMQHLERISQHFHPLASQENHRIAEYIVRTLLSIDDHAIGMRSSSEPSSDRFLEIFVDDPLLVRLDPKRVRLSTGGSSRLLNVTLVNAMPRYQEDHQTIQRVEAGNIYTLVTSTARRSSAALADVLLVTGHFDSAVTSRGAFDDGIAIALMLEVFSLNHHCTPTGRAHCLVDRCFHMFKAATGPTVQA